LSSENLPDTDQGLIVEPSSHKPPVPPYVAIFFAILAVSTAAIFIRLAQGSVPSLVIAAYRLTLASLILAPVALTRHRDDLKRLKRKEIGLAVLSGIFLALHFAAWITSLEYTTVASSVVLVTTSPLWVGLLSPLVLREPLKRPVLIGLMIALVGSIVVGLSDTCRWTGAGLTCPTLASFFQGRAFLGDLLALVGAFTAAGYLLIGRSLRTNMALVTYTFLVYGIAAMVLVAAVFAAGLQPWGFPPSALLWLLALAIFPQLIGHSTFNWALRYLSAAFVSVTLLGEPIGSTILALIFLGEVPTLIKVIGAVLIFAGIVIASRVERENAPPPPAADPAAGL
jgi:drug/metabolite transporter (DMT)-like permease